MIKRDLCTGYAGDLEQCGPHCGYAAFSKHPLDAERHDDALWFGTARSHTDGERDQQLASRDGSHVRILEWCRLSGDRWSSSRCDLAGAETVRLALYRRGNQRSIAAENAECDYESPRSTLTASGQWLQEGPSSVNRITKVNAVSIQCSKNESKCLESIGMVVGLDDGVPISLAGLLTTVQFEYAVTSWDKGIIVAAAETRAVDLTLNVDVDAGIISRTGTETTARGAKTSSPERREWILR